ncbi:CocE/NonD family hydrolase [Streptomyces sp. NPDC056500]|uniref:CocE/NonD family hydrolase n=1 Tax=Streptomyces sp. NPDC056500 TaxID=3345840 RepID=UPI00368C5429
MTVPFLRIGPSPLHEGAEQHLISMRDGTRLATDVYLPASPRKHAAVVSRLPYDKASAYMAVHKIAPLYLERGYVFIAQDVRGKFRSEGDTVPFVHEIEDTYDTLDWVAAQPWSNGSVAMVGDSYHGYTQWAGAAGGHPALRAIVPRVTSMEISDLSDLAGSGTDQALCLYFANYFAHMWVDKNLYAYEVDWSVRPLRDLFEDAFAAIGHRSAAVDSVISGRPLVDPFRTRAPLAGRPVPVLHRVGWFDNLIDASMRDHTAQLADPRWREHTYLDADACDHHTYHLDQAPVPPELDHGVHESVLDAVLPRYLGRTLDFLDAFVGGRGDPGSFPRAVWYQGHEGERTAASWPPPATRELRLHPAGASLATASADGGTLTETAEQRPTAVRWTHDPLDPVPSPVRDPWVHLQEYPDEQGLHGRPDVATFTGAPVGVPLDLVGPVGATVDIETSAAAGHLFVKLHDVSPDGSARMIVRGQCLISGQGPQSVRIDLGHTGYRLRPGHRLRLQICGSDFPLYAPHPGTDGDLWQATKFSPAEQTLRIGGDRTHLTLTVSDGSA